MKALSIAFAAGFFALGVAAADQQRAQPARENATATVIEIPTNVIGKDGKPVAGLAAADFELTDNGKKVTISGLDVVDLSATLPSAAGAPASVPPSARRLWLLVFDLTYTSPSGLVRARDGARAFVTDAMKPNDFAAVGTLSITNGWRLLLNFTRDRRQLAGAIDTLGLTADLGRTTDPLSFAFLPPGPAGGGFGPELPFSTKHGQEILDALRDLEQMRKTGDDALARDRVTKLVADIGQIGEALDAVRGRKHVLFFSEGFETRLLSGQMAAGDGRNAMSQSLPSSTIDPSTPQGVGDAALSGELWKIDSDTRFGNTGTRSRMLDALAQFNRSDSVLDAIDISGLRAEGDATGSQAGSGTDALFAMAAATDGDLVRNANQLSGELAKLQDRTSLVYLLAYQPKALSKPGSFHALKVKVKTAGAKVLARSGYYEPLAVRSLTPFERILATGDLVTGGPRENEIQANIMAVAFASPADSAQVPILLEIPGKSLLAEDASASKTIAQIYVYANDAAGTLVDYATSEMTLDLTKVRSVLEASGLKFYGTLYLPPGQFTVRALVRNAMTGRSGVFSTGVSVPEIPGSVPTVLPPFFEESPGRWLMIRGSPRPDAPARPNDYPFAIGGDSFIPAVLASLEAESSVRVAIVAYNFGPPGAKPEPLVVHAEVVAPDGQTRPANVTMSDHSDIERGDARKIVLEFKPQGLTPGRYVLKVAVSDPGTNRVAASSSSFEVK